MYIINDKLLINHFFSTIPKIICFYAWSIIDYFTVLNVKFNSLFDLLLLTSNFFPNKNKVRMEGPWLLALIPSASIFLSVTL